LCGSLLKPTSKSSGNAFSELGARHVIESGRYCEAINIIEDVLLWALRCAPELCRDLLADLMLAERRPVRVWAIGPLLASLRAWEALS
jgi:hypothetical protein